ncbi:hypothetical protein PWT90_07493 [Aphanocladium album]|nr:hypothetical protein PWT90_07493 [Aphanocladium album]
MTLASHIPQYHRLLTAGSSLGLSLPSVLMNTLVAQVQTGTMYYLFKSAPEMRYGIPIDTPPSLRDWLNLTQILTQWICSLFLFALVIYLPASSSNPAPAVRPKTVAVLLWILHVVLFLLSIPIGGRPEDIIFNIIRNINAGIINPLFTFIAAVAVVIQARAMPDQLMGCSHRTLGAQSLTYLILAISWPFRLILPPNMWELGPQPALLYGWYPWVGWACVNNAILAVGQGVMLFLSINRVADGHSSLADERRPLIGSDEL